MPRWIYLFCRRAVGSLDEARLLAGITDRDPRTHAGVDYLTLAEDYPVGRARGYERVVDAALARLEVIAPAQRAEVAFEVRYADWPARPLSVHRWDARTDGAALLRSLVAGGAPDELKLPQVRELVGIPLWRHQLDDMGVVLAYEVCRYLGQRGNAIVLNDEGEWQALDDGAWQPLAAAAGAKASGSTRRSAAAEARARFYEPGGSHDAAELLASLKARVDDDILDALLDEAMDEGGMNFIDTSPEALRALRQRIAALPARRAEALLAPPTGVRWRFIVDHPTPYVIDRAVREVRSWGRITNMYLREQAIEALSRLGVNAVDALVEALAQPCPQRIVLLAALAAIGAPEGRDTMLAYRKDRQERVRKVAAWGIDRLDRRTERASRKRPRWCAGCGLVLDGSVCPWCGAGLAPLPASPWRALATPRCPVDLRQT